MSITRRSLLAFAATTPAALAAPSLSFASSAADTPFQGTYRFTVGDATVTALLDGYIDIAPDLITGFEQNRAKASLKKAQQSLYAGGVRIPVNAFLIEMHGRRILIDAGTSNLLGDTLGDLQAALNALNVRPDTIEMIALTHIHPDHAGGLIDAQGAAVFANAQISIADEEYRFWHDDSIMASVPESARGFFQIARNSVAPYKDRLILHTGEEEVVSGLTSLPLPGHTPGHSGYILKSADKQLLFWGDVIHLTALQFETPGMTVAFDTDAQQTVQTRLKLLDRAVADDLLLTGAHIDFPGLGKVRRAQDGYAFQATPWQYGA
ncbi:MBL fold metallo-hydrolase [Shimia marina]|uniref:N-acyl homoserine lactonase n=1 Tax=Shimia marina TaxID=321267 RepID=A0A0P1ETF3_9RHOB|nr:MBL fold metallo-hydrolase [Shimia marina]CUH53623.1 N-acyl homoserine lactonase [Shimia marina]SFD72656.1 Glyoxylase, beta-lactamase superfamily II [Shimia marina]